MYISFATALIHSSVYLAVCNFCKSALFSNRQGNGTPNDSVKYHRIPLSHGCFLSFFSVSGSSVPEQEKTRRIPWIFLSGGPDYAIFRIYNSLLYKGIV
jgi:hypothetical protein